MKQKILDILSNNNDYISGEKISELLNISRTAVWKHIKSLKNAGYEIVSVTNRGYKLVSSPDILNADLIKSGLKTDFIAQNVVYYDETDSTNTQAKLHSDMPDGTLFISEVQTVGKGRRGRSWSSPKGSGIWMSFLLKPSLLPSDVAQITLIAGLAVCRALGNNAKIKWPNDIVIGSKKVCGILTEMSAEINCVNYVVCGIGINVNTVSFDEELSEKATSLFIETGMHHKRVPIVRKIAEEFEPLYKEFLESGMKNIIPAYRSECITIGREVSVIYQNKTINGKAIGIDNDGSLVVETADTTIIVSSGEVSVRGIYGYV